MVVIGRSFIASAFAVFGIRQALQPGGEGLEHGLIGSRPRLFQHGKIVLQALVVSPHEDKAVAGTHILAHRILVDARVSPALNGVYHGAHARWVVLRLFYDGVGGHLVRYLLRLLGVGVVRQHIVAQVLFPLEAPFAGALPQRAAAKAGVFVAQFAFCLQSLHFGRDHHFVQGAQETIRMFI